MLLHLLHHPHLQLLHLVPGLSHLPVQRDHVLGLAPGHVAGGQEAVVSMTEEITDGAHSVNLLHDFTLNDMM